MKRTTSLPATNAAPSEGQMRAALERYIVSRLEIDRIENEAKAQIEAIKAQAENAAKPHREALALSETVLMRYAEAHPELFDRRQKAEIYGGHKIGFHVSPPAVVLIRPPGEKRKQTWEGFLAACERIGTWALGLVRVTKEPDKEAILFYHRQALATEDPSEIAAAEANLARAGVAVRQEERFVIDLNLQPETDCAAA